MRSAKSQMQDTNPPGSQIEAEAGAPERGAADAESPDTDEALESPDLPRALRAIAVFLHEAIHLNYAATATVLFHRNQEENLYFLSVCNDEEEDTPADCPEFYSDVQAAIDTLEEPEDENTNDPLLGQITFIPEHGVLCARHLEDLVTLFRQISMLREYRWDSRNFSFYDESNPVPADDESLTGEMAEMSTLLLSKYPDLLGDMCNHQPYTSHKAMQRDVLRAYNLAANSQGGYLTYTLDDLDRIITAHHARASHFSDPHKPGLWLH